MPLFIIISGHLCKISLERKTIDGILRSNMNLLKITLIWSTIALIFRLVFRENQDGIVALLQYTASKYWFIWAIIFYRLIIATIYLICNHNYSKKYGIITVITFFILLLHPSRGIIIQYFLFFVFGFFVPKKAKNELDNIILKQDKKRLWLFLIAILICLLVLVTYLKQKIWAGDTLIVFLRSLQTMSIKNIIVSLAYMIIVYFATIVFVLGVYYIVKCISHWGNINRATSESASYISRIGMKSIEYYLVQSIILEEVLRHFIQYRIILITENENINVLVLSLFSYTLVALFIYLFNKLRIEKVLFGR